MNIESSEDLLYEIAKNQKELKPEQADIILFMVKAFRLENDYLERKGIIA